jgi:hypothetical protein
MSLRTSDTAKCCDRSGFIFCMELQIGVSVRPDADMRYSVDS